MVKGIILKEKLCKIFQEPWFLILIAFLLWLYSFREYFMGGLGLTSDAISYYEHIRFFIVNLQRGHFPLWDPYWSGGVPNDFFLRRFCPYNPFYLFIIFPSFIGLPYYFCYIFFLAFYLFFGMVGFYLLSRKLTGDHVASFVAFIILLFSSMSTRIFDSYMIFIVTPLAWFFYFLVSFASNPNRFNLIGLTFFLMLLMTTYIPLYFFVILLSFTSIFPIIYVNKIQSLIFNLIEYITTDRWVVILCILAIVFSVLPGLIFFQEAGNGSISIPGRHYNTVENHALAVQDQSEDSWAVPEEFFFSAYYLDLQRITFAIVYIPCFAFILLVLGVGIRISALMVFLAVWGAVMLLLTSPFASPLYSFLRANFFFFKYFRNLHFLLWFAIIPILALFVGEIFRSFRQELMQSANRWIVFWVILLHAILFFVFCLQPHVLWITKATVVISGVFFLYYCSFKKFRDRDFLVRISLLALIVVHPMAVYHYFVKNVPARSAGFYDDIGPEYNYKMYVYGEGKKEGRSYNLIDYPHKPSGKLYYATSYYNDLRTHIPMDLVAVNEQYRFMAYDRVSIDIDPVDWEKLTMLWKQNANTAVIEAGYSGPQLIGDGGMDHPRVFGSKSEEFRIIKGNTDAVCLATRFSVPKLLVFNDSFHKGWKAAVNGRQERVWRVNGAFKGVVVPAGPAEVVFSFGSAQERLVNYFLFLLFYGIGAVLVISLFNRDLIGFPKGGT